jgi:FemAB-related protein (PEP-CTERM system-associated)
MLTVTPMTAADREDWDGFVRAHTDATFFHLSAWAGVIERGFGHRPRYLLARRAGAPAGVLPLIEQNTVLFGHALISTSFLVYGGPVAADAEAETALVEAAVGLRAETGAASLELRFRQRPSDAALPGDWHAKEGLYATFRRTISGNDDANLKAIPRKQRAVVRKGIERGLAAAVDRDVDRLHRIYSESVRNLGTPVFSRRWFRAIAEAFPNDMDVLTVLDAGTPVAAVLNFYWRDEVLPYYGGGTAAARTCQANDFMYWEVMRRAAARGCRLFDFGRSKEGTGAYAFKKNWGFEPEPLAYRVHTPPGKAPPEINPLNPKYRLMVDTWKKLPLPVANLLGPHIVRGTG